MTFPEQPLTLIGKRLVAQETIEFEFRKPRGFTYKAGQYIGIDLTVGKTRKENVKSFSFSSAPYELRLAITMRITDSPFKQQMANLELGSKVNVQGPFGNFIIRPGDEEKNIYFLAQGIGITPFFSIIKQSIWEKKTQTRFLFYQNHSFERTAYYEELALLKRQDILFDFALFIPSEEQLAILNSKSEDKLFFLCGSEPGIESYKTLLAHAGIDKKDIRVERFEGYI